MQYKGKIFAGLDPFVLDAVPAIGCSLALRSLMGLPYIIELSAMSLLLWSGNTNFIVLAVAPCVDGTEGGGRRTIVDTNSSYISCDPILCVRQFKI